MTTKRADNATNIQRAVPTEQVDVPQQQNLLTVLCHHEKGKAIADLVKAELFEGDYRTLAERAIEYWDKYGEAPKDHTADLVNDILEKGDGRAGTFRQILIQMVLLSETINIKYVMDSIHLFVEGQKLKQAILKSAETVNSGRLRDTKDILADALADGLENDLGGPDTLSGGCDEIAYWPALLAPGGDYRRQSHGDTSRLLVPGSSGPRADRRASFVEGPL
jgi:hypothetical protein